MSVRIAEIDQHAIAHILGNKSIETAYGFGSAFLVGRNNLSEVLRVHARGERRRTDQIAEHHSYLTTLGALFRTGAWEDTQCARCVNGGRFITDVATQRSNSIEQLHAVAERRDAKLFQVLCREARKNCFVNLVFAERSLILSKAKAAQPTPEVHNGSPIRPSAYDRL